MLRIVIQSSGRVKSESLSLLDKVGVKINKFEENTLLAKSTEFPAEVFFVEKTSVAKWVADGLADIGICSEFMLAAREIEPDCIVRRLGFERVTLSLLIPHEAKYDGVKWFNNRVVATPYPEILQQYFRVNAIKATVRPMYEQVYRAVNAGVADAVFDKVYSGTSLVSEHLREVEKVINSEAVVMVSPRIAPSRRLILEELLSRIDSVLAATSKKFVSMNVPSDKVDRISELLPSLCSHNIAPSKDPDWVAISTVMDETRLWDIVDKLRMLGVREIIACPIDNLIV